jgi:hypothetical protein
MDNTDITDEGFTDINEKKKKNLNLHVEKNKNHENYENYENEENSPPKWYDTPLSSGATSKSIVSNVLGLKTVKNTDYHKNDNNLDNDDDNNDNDNDNHNNNSMSFPEIHQQNENSYPNGPFSPVRPYRAPYLTSPWGQSSEESIEVAAERVGIKLPKHMTAEMLQIQSKVGVMQRQIDARDKTIRSLETDYALQVIMNDFCSQLNYCIIVLNIVSRISMAFSLGL